jgi:hypothetical protein
MTALAAAPVAVGLEVERTGIEPVTSGLQTMKME